MVQRGFSDKYLQRRKKSDILSIEAIVATTPSKYSTKVKLRKKFLIKVKTSKYKGTGIFNMHILNSEKKKKHTK